METNTWLKRALGLLALVEVGIVGYWISYLWQAGQGLLKVGIISEGVVTGWIDVEAILSALGWLAVINAAVILFAFLYIRNSHASSIMLTISLIIGLILYIRAAFMFGRLMWLYGIGLLALISIGGLAALPSVRRINTKGGNNV